jgi:hypothetical protein
MIKQAMALVLQVSSTKTLSIRRVERHCRSAFQADSGPYANQKQFGVIQKPREIAIGR